MGLEGIAFEIRNEYGKQLFDLLDGIADPAWHWFVGAEEAYFAGNGQLSEPFFFETDVTLDGKSFLAHISKEDYILIFADLKAFPTAESVASLLTEREFMESPCILGINISDSAHVILYSRESWIIHEMIKRVESLGYGSTRFLSHDNLVYAIWGWREKYLN